MALVTRICRHYKLDQIRSEPLLTISSNHCGKGQELIDHVLELHHGPDYRRHRSELTLINNSPDRCSMMI